MKTSSNTITAGLDDEEMHAWLGNIGPAKVGEVEDSNDRAKLLDVTMFQEDDIEGSAMAT